VVTIDQAAQLLDTAPENLSEFCCQDTFNGNQTIEGWLCKVSDHRYGALVIWRVAGHETEPQVIWCTPKLHYPFGRTQDGTTRIYHPWLKGEHEFVVYEKLDGTNVLAYWYQDHEGREFLTYKTRLTPVLQANRFLDAAALWRRAMVAVGAKTGFNIEGTLWFERRSGFNYSYSFELYGYDNPLTVVYSVPIYAKLLFCVAQNNHAVELPRLGFGLSVEKQLAASGNFVEVYEAWRQNVTSATKIREDGRIAGPDGKDGLEGYVFYCLVDGVYRQMKCKSAQMESAHWANGAIPLDVITATAWNALESYADLTADYVREMLLEEFTKEQVALSATRIDTAISHVLERFTMKQKIAAVLKELGLQGGGDRGAVMRAMSRHFEKREIKLVYWVLNDMGVFARKD